MRALLAASFDRPASPLVPLLTKQITNTICQVRLSPLKFPSDLWECYVAMRSISAASRFGRSDSNADDIDAYPGAPGQSLGPYRTSRRQMVLTVGERPWATVRLSCDLTK